MAVGDLKDKHVNQYLTNFSVGYRMMDNVADFAAPPFKVKRLSDKYLEFNASVFRIYDNKMGRREKVKEINRQATSSTYSCEKYALGTFIVNDDLTNVDKPIRLKEEEIEGVKDAMILAREKRISDICTSQSLITNNVNIGGDWSTAGGTPVADFLTGMAAIYEATYGAAKPNAAIIPYTVALKAIQTTEWKSYFQYTWGLKASGDGLFDLMAGLKHIGIDARIAGAFGTNTYEGTSSDPDAEALWGENVLLFVRKPNPTTRTLCFMHSPYTEKDVVREYRTQYEEEGGIKYTITEKIDELLVSASCAYLMYNTI